jgi:hypothetical protein
METADIICMLIAVFVGIAFVLDMLGASWAALKKKEYKSILGHFIEDWSDNHSLWWLPAVVAILFAYGLLVLERM